MTDTADQAELIRALASFNHGAQSPPVGSSAEPSEADALIDRFDRLEAEVERLIEEIDGVESRSQRRSTALGQSLRALNEAIEASDGSDSWEADVAGAEAAIGKLANATEAVRERSRKRFATVDEEFENLERLLVELHQRVRSNGATVAANEDAIATIERTLTRLEDLQAVAVLQRQANQVGAHRADCHACGEPVDVGLLTTADCPHCSASFEDLDSETRWFRTHHELV